MGVRRGIFPAKGLKMQIDQEIVVAKNTESSKRKPLTEEQRAKKREAQKRWKAKNLDKVRADREKWAAANRDKVRERLRRWKANNPEKIRAYEQNRDKEKMAAYRKQWWAAHPEKWAEALQRWAKSRIEWRAANPDKVREYKRQYREKQAKLAPVKRPPVGEVLNKQLMGDAIYAAAFKALPKTLPSDVRDAVISDIYMAVMEDRLAIGDIAKRSPEFVKGYWRQFGHQGRVSLDELVFEDGARTRLDDVTYEDAVWA
jgi:hypothetical protein